MEIQTIKISELKRAKYNPRKNLQPEDEEYKKLEKSIDEFGHVLPIVVNFDKTVIGGHQNLTVLENKGYKEVVCSVVNLNKTQEKALNLALNKISGEWDYSKLKDILSELKETDMDLSVTGFDFDEVDDILADITGSKEDDFDIEEALEEIKEPKTKQGDIWCLGNHKLMCGDSTKKNDVLKLMSINNFKNKKEADLCLTDPPYNVNYQGKTEENLKIKNDNLTETEFYNFLLDSFRNMYEVSKYGCPVYIFHSEAEGINFRNAFISVGYKLAQCLIWVKNNFVLGRQDYQWRHEPILYGWKEGASHYFVDDRTKNTILEFDKPIKNEEHPTMKPIDLLAYLIKNSTKEDDLVLDLFGGSGSTLIAAEETKRICYTMELDPKYCDVIIKRWENLTGKKAELEFNNTE